MSRDLVSPREPLGSGKWVSIHGVRCQIYERDWKRFLSFVVIDDSSMCWNWVGYRWGRNLRPAFGGVGGRQRTATHVALAWKTGEVPVGLEVCHSCDNENCVNPDHLWVGSHQQNMKDMWQKGRGYDGLSALRAAGLMPSRENTIKGWETKRRKAAEGV